LIHLSGLMLIVLDFRVGFAAPRAAMKRKRGRDEE
jgi:hypothetical protein